ncbi:putative Cell division control protein 31 [Blattamonas nauphoetae]|uniref:Cell division control protein 31 n=1 Tax=Blattamonas nauphoetae TaxID=2049346 RepID=A0ABQ9YK67_9EUKA|nr:putative Cell division control protein 31 [Blattamonas nauphoetae]
MSHRPGYQSRQQIKQPLTRYPRADDKSSSQPRFDLAVLQSGKQQKKRFELTPQDKSEIKESFEIFDSENKGYLTYYQLKVAIRSLGVRIKKAEVIDLMQQFGSENQVDYDAFVSIMTYKFSQRDPNEEIDKAFILFVEEGKGVITARQLRKIAREIGETINDNELQAMIDEFDKDQDGAINANEFAAIMKQTGLFE